MRRLESAIAKGLVNTLIAGCLIEITIETDLCNQAAFYFEI